tara:strand:+ start:1106 stop:1267 length:162 start_codon:yes stop_codon:yes gene_type:complete
MSLNFETVGEMNVLLQEIKFLSEENRRLELEIIRLKSELSKFDTSIDETSGDK